MAMKAILVCVVAFLCCLCDAQYFKNSQHTVVAQAESRPLTYMPPPQPPQKPAPSSQIYHHPQKLVQPQRPKDPVGPAPEMINVCEVAANYKIQCGPPSISAAECQAINCCFDGQMCYYGRAVTLQCTKDAQFIIVVARDTTVPNIDLETISFYGQGQRCAPVGVTSAFAIYQFFVTDCGTVMMDEPGVLIYENRMNSMIEVAMGDHGQITRDTQFDLLVQCRYTGTSVDALVIEVDVLALVPIAAPGPLRVELRLANGGCVGKGCVEADVAYNSFYTDADYPITKVLRDPVYVEIRMLERTDPNLVLTLGHCWTTTSPNSLSTPKWDLLIDGCPYSEDPYQTALVPVGPSAGLMYPTHHRRFVFKMFTFISATPSEGGKGSGLAMTPLHEKVYIHCNTAVCQPSIGDNCEPRCYRRRRDVDSSRGFSTPETAVVSSGAILIARE